MLLNGGNHELPKQGLIRLDIAGFIDGLLESGGVKNKVTMSLNGSRDALFNLKFDPARSVLTGIDLHIG